MNRFAFSIVLLVTRCSHSRTSQPGCIKEQQSLHKALSRLQRFLFIGAFQARASD
jgi:hypothetical protein